MVFDTFFCVCLCNQSSNSIKINEPELLCTENDSFIHNNTADTDKRVLPLQKFIFSPHTNQSRVNILLDIFYY